MEAINQRISNRLKDFEFHRVRHPNPTPDSADPPTLPEENPFTIVPHFHNRQPWQSSTTAAFEFLRQLPLIPPPDLPEENLICLICHELYVRPQPTEMPTMLPCQHIFGRKCIAQWIIPSYERPKNTCPLCRSELFDEETFDEAIASPVEESDSADWVNDTRRLHQNAPHGNLRLESLARDLERIGRETILQTRTAIAADVATLRATVIRYGDMVREQERRIEELVGPLEGLRENPLRERLRHADWAEVERLETDLMMLQDTTRMLREVFPIVTGLTGVESDGAGTDGEAE